VFGFLKKKKKKYDFGCEEEERVGRPILEKKRGENVT